jgi:hypothetical protein
MKKLAFSLLAAALLTSCAKSKIIDGVEYRPYGLLNEESCKNDSIYYQVSAPAVCSGIIFSEMIIPPVYVFGYNLWEPVSSKKDRDAALKGVVR